MSTQTLTQPTTRIQPRKFTADEFIQMYELGIFSDSERLELLEGEVIVMAPIGPPHASTVDTLNSMLVHLAGSAAIVRGQNPIILDERSLPQPDFALLKPRDDRYRSQHPQPHDVFLVIEVSQTSLNYDRQRKLPLYAKAKIPEVWIVDLNKQQVEQFSQPEGEKYKQHTVKARGASIVASQLSAITFEIDQLFA